MGVFEGFGVFGGLGAADGSGVFDCVGAADGEGTADRVGAADALGAADGLGAAEGLAAFDGSDVADGLAALDGVVAVDGLGAADGVGASDALGAANGVGAPDGSGAAGDSGVEAGGAGVWVRVDPEEVGSAARFVPAVDDGKGEASLPEALGSAPGFTSSRFGAVVLTRTPASTPRIMETPSAAMLRVVGHCMIYTVNQWKPGSRHP